MAGEPPSLQLPDDSQRRTSLYVGDLDPEVTEMDLETLFRPVGPILSLRLCRCSRTRKSLCYAYVNFYSHSHASKGLAHLNHADLRGKPVRLMWSHRNPFARRSGIGNLFVKNLDHSINSARLESVFCKFGTILSCKVAEENGKSKGFGFVQFDSEHSAMAALTALHDTMLEGKKLYVSKFVKKSERIASVSGEELKFTNLYVKNLSENMTEVDLCNMFSVFGKVCNVAIMRDHNGKSKCFGFVNFELAEDARKAVNTLNGSLLGSKILFVGRAQKKTERAKILKEEYMFNSHIEKWRASNLYVKNLNKLIDDNKLKELFSSFGRIVSAKVMHHVNGDSRGFGFVCFSSPEEANKAMDNLDGTMFEGKYLQVAIAQRRKDRLLELHNRFANYIPQSLYVPNYSIVPFSIHPTYFSFPPSLPLSHHPISYDHAGANVGICHPFATQYYHKSFSPYIPAEQSHLVNSGNTKDLPHEHHTITYPPSYPGDRDLNSKYGRGQNFDSRNKGNRRGGASGGSAPAPRLTVSKPPGNSNKDIADLVYPLVENLQPRQAGTIIGMLPEISNSDITNLLNSTNSLASQVDRGVQVLKESNTLTTGNSDAALYKPAHRLTY